MKNILAALAVFSIAMVIWGQASTTSLRGTVSDSSGAVLPGAKMTLTNAGSQASRQTTTGPEGEYEFQFLAPGTYTLTVTANGFESYTQTGLSLLVNTPATADVQMQVGAVSESVTVNATISALNTVDASIGNSFDNNQVVQMPIEGRNVPDLLSLQTGVVYTGNSTDVNTNTDTRSGSVDGARSDQSNVTLDGVDSNDQSAGQAFYSVLPVTLDSVQEFRVTTSDFDASQGNGSGAQMALVTKSGTNQYHGSLYEYLRNTATSANDYFIKKSELASGLPNKPQTLNYNIFGTSLGGPVKKDKLFFFANYEGTRINEALSEVETVPSANLRNGIISYPCTVGSANCPAAGFVTLSSANITALDPLHEGPVPAVLSYFQTYPLPNDTTVGDGYNFEGFRFGAPSKDNNDVGIARIDYHISSTQTLFVRGAIQDLRNPGPAFLPGKPPENTIYNHSGGIAVGYTIVFGTTKVNNFHYGLTRESITNLGDSTQTIATFSGLSQGITHTDKFSLPVHNFVDDFSWVRGTHTFQFGANIGITRNSSISYLHSYSTFSDTVGDLNPTGFADTNSPLDPVIASGGTLPEVPASLTTTYDYPMAALLGVVSNVDALYNYTKAGPLLAQGAPVNRDFGLKWYELYAQDSWRVKPNLTLTYGVRWSILPPPWEVNGNQVSPSFSLGKQFIKNEQNMEQGLGYNSEPLITFSLAGPANNGPGFYPLEKTDFAPRLGVAYTPHVQRGWLAPIFGTHGQSVIRGGVSEVYDRPGFEIMNTFNQNGSFGMSTSLNNPCCIYGITVAARLTNVNTIPATNQQGTTIFLPAPPGGFPATPPVNGEEQSWGMDDTLKTPHAWTADFSIGRDFGAGFSLQLAYVGRFGRELLAQRDLDQPLDIVDPKSKVDYFTAATVLSKLVRAGTSTSSVTASNVGSTAAYWQDMVQPLKSGGAYSLTCSGGSTQDVVQAVYDIYLCQPYVEVLALGNIDYYGYLTDANLPGVSYYFNDGPSSYLNNQFASLFAWSSIAHSDYNALQVTLNKRLGAGVQFVVNYTYSKSLDNASAAARDTQNGGLPGSAIVNSFSPNQNWGPSDFDTTQQINGNWIVQLPFAKGSHGFENAALAGWEITGIVRRTSGFPISVVNGESWPTDWSLSGVAQEVGVPKTGVYKDPKTGNLGLFQNPTAAFADFIHPFPGGTGSRNVLRGDGTAGWDMGLDKRWELPFEHQSVQFRWEVFNVPNLVRFDVNSAPPNDRSASKFGDYSGLLVTPRVMQFALRYEF